jgi:hypothetical protein
MIYIRTCRLQHSFSFHLLGQKFILKLFEKGSCIETNAVVFRVLLSLEFNLLNFQVVFRISTDPAKCYSLSHSCFYYKATSHILLVLYPIWSHWLTKVSYNRLNLFFKLFLKETYIIFIYYLINEIKLPSEHVYMFQQMAWLSSGKNFVFKQFVVN